MGATWERGWTRERIKRGGAGEKRGTVKSHGSRRLVFHSLGRRRQASHQRAKRRVAFRFYDAGDRRKGRGKRTHLAGHGKTTAGRPEGGKGREKSVEKRWKTNRCAKQVLYRAPEIRGKINKKKREGKGDDNRIGRQTKTKKKKGKEEKRNQKGGILSY